MIPWEISKDNKCESVVDLPFVSIDKQYLNKILSRWILQWKHERFILICNLQATHLLSSRRDCDSHVQQDTIHVLRL